MVQANHSRRRPQRPRITGTTIPEYIWQRAEYLSASMSNNGRKERLRYIREGRLIPEIYSQPQLMVKSDGVWKPEIRLMEPLSHIIERAAR